MHIARFLRRAKLPAAAVLCLAGAQASHAALIEAALPSNAYITKNGFNWAWAFPLEASSGLDLSYQSKFGWRLPTLAELNLAPLATDFLFPGANVPFNGIDPVSGAQFQFTNSVYTLAMSAGACATPYFSNSFSHCDFGNGKGQDQTNWAGGPGAPNYAEQLVVRGVSAVPLPASAPLFGISLLALGAAGWRVKRKEAAIA